MSFANPVLAAGEDLGDPFVLEFLGTYHLFHSSSHGVRAWTSADLLEWEDRGLVLEPGGWAQGDFWAPEVVLRDGAFWLYVAAAPDPADDWSRRIGVARAAHPLGPYEVAPAPLLDQWSIDAHPYRAPDGSWWLFYNTRSRERPFRGSHACSVVVTPLPEPDGVGGPVADVTFPSEDWEGNRDGSWYFNEGSWVTERRGVFHHQYSGGSFDDDTYAIGSSTAPSPAGPWTKDPDNPLFTGTRRLQGPGHHSVALAPDGVTAYACYHAHLDGAPLRCACLDRVHFAGDRVQVAAGHPVEGPQPRPPGPHGGVAGDLWHARAWVRGPEVRLGGVAVPLGPGWHLAEARRRHDQLTLRLDGIRVHAGPATDAELEADEVRAASRTGVHEDAAVHRVDGTRSWACPDGDEVEATVAVRGEATVRLGDGTARVAPSGRFALVVLRGRATALEVRARGAEVTDVLLAARAAG